MKYYRDVVCPLMESGEIVICELQKPYELQSEFTRDGYKIKPITYVADFYLMYKDGSEIVVDVKGCPDSVAKLKRKLFWFRYPELKYIWVTCVKKYGGWIDYDEYKRLKRVEKIKNERK